MYTKNIISYTRNRNKKYIFALLHMLTFLFCYTCSHFYSPTHIHIFILLHIFTFIFCYTYSHLYSVTHIHIFILLHMFTFLLFRYTCSLSLHSSINYHSYSLCKPYHPIKAFLQFFSLFLGKKSILIIAFPGVRTKYCSQVVTFV